MKSTIKILGFLCASFAMIQCDKDEAPNTAPSLLIISPDGTKAIEGSDSLEVAVDFMDSKELHNYSIEIKNRATGHTAYTDAGHQHGTELQYRKNLKLEIKAHSDMVLIATVSNHLDEISTDSVYFHMHPNGGSGGDGHGDGHGDDGHSH